MLYDRQLQIIDTADLSQEVTLQEVIPQSKFEKIRKNLYNNTLTKARHVFQQVREGIWQLRDYATTLTRSTSTDDPPMWYRNIEENQEDVAANIVVAQRVREMPRERKQSTLVRVTCAHQLNKPNLRWR